MERFSSVDEVLDMAIRNEIEAHDMYTGLAQHAGTADMKAAFMQFAMEELGHKAKLEAVKAGKKMLSAQAKVLDLKIGDYLVDIAPREGMTYQEALIIAMQAEKKAYRLYLDLSKQVADPELVELFLALAQEEAKHKLRFEVEYDDVILRDN